MGKTKQTTVGMFLKHVAPLQKSLGPALQEAFQRKPLLPQEVAALCVVGPSTFQWGETQRRKTVAPMALTLFVRRLMRVFVF